MMLKINISIVGSLYQLFPADSRSNLPTVVIMFRLLLLFYKVSSECANIIGIAEILESIVNVSTDVFWHHMINMIT